MANDNTKDIEPDNQEIIRDDKGRFVPGVSGNPKGRPVNEESPTYWLRKFLDEVDPSSKDGRKRIEEIAILLAVQAKKGEAWAMKEIFDRLDGRARESVDVTSGGEQIEGLVMYRPNKDESNMETVSETRKGASK
jgi:hypothetical protein